MVMVLARLGVLKATPRATIDQLGAEFLLRSW